MHKIEDLLTDTIKRIDALNMSMSSFRKVAGLGKNTLRNMRKPGWSPSTTTLTILQQTLTQLESMSSEELSSYLEQRNMHPHNAGGQDTAEKHTNMCSVP